MNEKRHTSRQDNRLYERKCTLKTFSRIGSVEHLVVNLSNVF